MRQKLTDPADKVVEKKEEERLETEAKGLDIESLSFEDFKAIPPEAAKTPHPFDGYPLGKKVKLLKAEISSTFIVGLNPKVYVAQDPSGRGVTIPKREGKSMMETIQDIKTVHSRVVVDHESGMLNKEYIFDVPMFLKDGQIDCAVVESHSARAQICFKMVSTPRGESRIMVDDRYLLLDRNQFDRLRRTFVLIHTPQANIERLSRAITGESIETVEETPRTPLE